HQRHRAGGENADAVERAALADHLEKPGVVVRRRHESRAAGEASARTLDIRALSAGALRGARNSTIGAARVHRREPAALLARQEEMRVLHAKRAANARANELVERYARGP